MSKMGAYVLEIQTKQHEEYASGQAESVRSGRLGDKSSMGYDMVRGGLPTKHRRGNTLHYGRGVTHDTEQSGCDSGTQFDWVRFGETE